MSEARLDPPSHDVVRRAVQDAGDAELIEWTDSPESYVMRPAARQGERIQLFHVILVDVPHPMGFLLAVDGASGEGFVTSGRPDGVRRAVEADSTLTEPAAVWDLVHDPPIDGELVDGDLVDEHGERRYTFHVRDRVSGELRTFALVISGTGAAWERGALS